MLTGALRKMRVTYVADGPVLYELPVGDGILPLNERIGKTLKISFGGEILCGNCGKKTKKSYNGGYCFPCARKLASCDLCIVKPELCHYHKGTCREPEWGEKHCFIPHTVYLSNTSGLKVGITRSHQRVTRWIDQGATQALPILVVNTRLDAGLVEVALKRHIADKTDWRAMLKGLAEPCDLPAKRDELLSHVPGEITVEPCDGEAVIEIRYPVEVYPEKIVSLNLDKTPEIEGTLIGIKGQYLIFDRGVINIRKYSSYQVSVS